MDNEAINLKDINIAIDGFSGCGKSTLAKQLATELGMVYVDTGAMYRAITLLILENGQQEDSILEIISSCPKIEFGAGNEVFINGENREKEIRGSQVASNVSQFASNSLVRNYLKGLQRSYIHKKGVVMEGRDIASVIMPDADLKLFITASLKERVRRRHKQLNDSNISLADVEQNLMSRDKQDIGREIAPLTLVDDAIVIDTTDLSEREQLKMAKALATPLIFKDSLLGSLS